MYNAGVEKEPKKKNKYHRKGCLECAKALIKAAEFMAGIGGKEIIVNIHDTCRHCGNKQTIEIGKKTYIEVYKTIALYVIIIVSITSLFIGLKLNTQFAYLLNSYDVQ